jgi:hypothetical protein
MSLEEEDGLLLKQLHYGSTRRRHIHFLKQLHVSLEEADIFIKQLHMSFKKADIFLKQLHMSLEEARHFP